jgi:hypothetical protein
MEPSPDLRELLERWPFDSENCARIVRGTDQREILQVRLPLGIEQYELDGRPDGRRPHDVDSALDFHLARLNEAQARGEADAFRLSPKECAELFEEGVLYYYRYLHLFHLKDWARTARDTSRNLRLFDFVHEHARRKEDRLQLEQWRPYILRMNAIARAMLEVGRQAHDQALKIIRQAIETVEALPALDNPTFQVERDRALDALRESAAEIESNRPVSERQRLERELRTAVETQEFERAADLRDRIRLLSE